MSNKHINIIWNEIDWIKNKKFIRKVQYRIYKARSKDNFSLVHWLQKFIINSTPAKLLAVHQVTT